MNIVGIPIGFYGYLFPGNINLMVLELYSTKRYLPLFFITLLILIFESIYCFCTLYFLNQSAMQQAWFGYVEWGAYILTLCMGLWMLLEKSTTIKGRQYNIHRGIINTIIHPQQIPFWLLMGVLFHDSIHNMMDKWSLPLFVVYNAIGTALVLGCYAFFGNRLMSFFNLKMKQINQIAGVLFIIISVVSILGKIRNG